LLKALKELTPHENIYTVPNILTATRLIAAPVIGYLVLHDYHAWAVGLFAYAGITDLVDGWIARKWKLQTVVGTVIDPMADKTLMTILTVCLAMKGALPGISTLARSKPCSSILSFRIVSRSPDITAFFLPFERFTLSTYKYSLYINCFF
jgi:phosphatidylglycerophosphate synthase